MKVPSALQGESLTRLIQGAIAGAVAAIAIGFGWGGWVTGSTANKMMTASYDKAVIATLAPGCAAQFRKLPDSADRMAVLVANKDSSWRMRDAFPPALITLPGRSYVDSDLANACGALLLVPGKSAEAK